ncbi:hypothetical protein HDV05_008492, partial [Chytridiales sp. JEL 0842]
MKAEFVLKVVSHGRELKLMTNAIEPVQQILSGIKRAISIASHSTTSIEKRFSWLHYYENHLTPTTKGPEDGQKIAASNPFIMSDFTLNPLNAKAIKDNWMMKQLRLKEKTFSSFKPANIFVGSWNVNGNPPTEPLAEWIKTEEDVDIFVFGFQELDLSNEAYVFSDRTKETEWCNAIETALGQKSEPYSKIASKQLVGMLIIVYAKYSHVANITEVSTESVGTGILGLMGNKGSTGCRFRFYDSYFCFINSHLAADTNQVARRNQDYNEICKRLQYSVTNSYPDYFSYVLKNPWVTNTSDITNSSNVQPGKTLCGIHDTDHLFWLGDLNYRVPVGNAEAKLLIQKGDVEKLLQSDQLLIEKANRRAFADYEEAKISFLPTYKYDVGTSQYDT